MSTEVIFYLFLGAIILLAVARNWEKLSGVQAIAGSATTGLKGMLASLWGTGKGLSGLMGTRLMGLLLWSLVVLSFGLLFPEAFAAWWSHQNIFWISQLVAVLLILFLPVKFSTPLFGLVIAFMLWDAIVTTFNLEDKAETQKQVAKIARTDTKREPVSYKITHDKWTVVRIPNKHYFYFDCFGSVEVEVLDNRIPIDICDNRERPISLGNRIRPPRDRSSGAFAMRAVAEDGATVVVTVWPM